MFKLKVTKDKTVYAPNIESENIKGTDVAKVTIKDKTFAAEYGEAYKANRNGIVINKNNKSYHLLNSISGGTETPDEPVSTILWSVDFSMPKADTAITLTDVFTDEQKAMLTDDACGGVDFDGKNRHVHAYFIGCEEAGVVANPPIELPFFYPNGFGVPSVIAASEAQGLDAHVNGAYSGWSMDSELVFETGSTGYGRQFRITFDSVPFSDPE